MLIGAFRHSPGRLEQQVDDDGAYPAADHVDYVVGTDIDSGHAHQDVEWHDQPEQPAALGAPGKEQQDGGDAYMTAGEGCRGAFTGFVGTGYALVEEPVAVTRGRQRLVVGGKIVVKVGEYALSDVVQTCRRIIVLRSCNGQEDEDDVVDEERGEDDEYRTVELCVSPKEIECCHECYQRVVGSIAQMHQFTENGIADRLGEEQCRLTAEQLLFNARKEMVEIGEYLVQFIGIRIPPGEQQELYGDTAQQRESAGVHAIDAPHGRSQRHHLHATPYQ
mgnify:CR=1 FL=1